MRCLIACAGRGGFERICADARSADERVGSLPGRFVEASRGFRLWIGSLVCASAEGDRRMDVCQASMAADTFSEALSRVSHEGCGLSAYSDGIRIPAISPARPP